MILEIPISSAKNWKNNRQNKKTKKRASLRIFHFIFCSWFLSSLPHRELGEMILEIPISSPKNAEKKSNCHKIFKKVMFLHFFISNSLWLNLIDLLFGRTASLRGRRWGTEFDSRIQKLIRSFHPLALLTHCSIGTYFVSSEKTKMVARSTDYSIDQN